MREPLGQLAQPYKNNAIASSVLAKSSYGWSYFYAFDRRTARPERRQERRTGRTERRTGRAEQRKDQRTGAEEKKQ
jgi:hypothetical protein